MQRFFNHKHNRNLHRWTAIIISLPFVVVIFTGIFLQVRKPIDWIQPPTLTGSAQYEPTVKLEHLLAQVKTVPEMEVDGWEDIKLLDLRPEKDIVKVRNHRHLETQIDVATGEILQVAQRRNDVVVFWHEGSAIGGRPWIFLPVGMVL